MLKIQLTLSVMINVFTKKKIGGLLFLFLALSYNLHAQQYKFNSKSDKKLYAKLEKAYDAADYEFILDNETKLLSSFETKQDTLSALVYSFLGEAYYFYNGDRVKGLDYYQKDLELKKKILPNSDNSETLFNIAGIQDELGYYDKSEKIYLEILKNDEKNFGKKSEEYIETALSIAIHYTYSLEPEKGIKILKSIEKYIVDFDFELSLFINLILILLTER